MQLHFTPAIVVSLIGALLAVIASYWAGLTQENIHAILILVGLIGAGITVGGGVKSAAQIRAGVHVGNLSFRYTAAALTAIVAAGVAVAVTFGAHFTQENTNSILTLVGLLFAGIVGGASIKSHAYIATTTKADKVAPHATR